MTATPLATAVTRLGGVAGLLAVAGLLVLTVVYVRHRREVTRLCEWAASARIRAPRAVVAHRATRATTAVTGRRLGVGVAVGATAVSLAIAGVLGFRLTRGESTSISRIDDLGDLTHQRRAAIRVAVLNGTSAPGLANRTAGRLTTLGFAKGVVRNAPMPTGSSTIVAYVDPDGSGPAVAIARFLRAGRPVAADPATREIAQRAEVIVTVGSHTVQ